MSGAALDENLLDIGLRGAGQAADGVSIERRIAPAEHREPFFAGDALQDSFAENPFVAVDGQERHANAVFARSRQLKAQAGALALEKSVRNLDQNAGAVAGLRIAAAGAPVRQIDQNLNALEDDIVRLVPGNIGHKTDAASIVFLLGIIEALSRRQAEKWILFTHFSVHSEYHGKPAL